MAEDELLGGLGDTASQVAGGAADAIIIIFSILIFVGIIATIFLLVKLVGQYKHFVKIRVITSTRKFIIEDKARDIKIDGVPYWKLRKTKETVQVPPAEATELTKKGQLYAECYWTEEKGYTWITDTGKPEKGFDSFTTVQRSLLVQRLSNARLRRKKGVWEMLQQFITPIILLLIFILILVFWQDIAEPTNQVLEKAGSITAKQAEITNQQARIAAVQAGVADPSTLDVQQTVNDGGGQ